MKKSDKYLLYITHTLTLMTGLLYGVTIYFLEPENAWDVVNHPMQIYFQQAHILVSPILVFIMGLIWQAHIRHKLEVQETLRKTSGLILIYSFIVMVLSGYLIQISVSEIARNIMVGMHLISSGLWSLVFFIHLRE
jgi:hypothetical protein